ncbi:hypothetical protein CSUNSWCD_1117 [Campylobacter showae CSUNSWCD]|uniref:Uncharacterized protein n=1 Tax=Campylobacter showae CSUNSWCD TaxID=1244083 RepID=M5IHD5_9BACT|nr:hypothetical protein CSUNSWCD_1117 [Campylobacter showae CSUNSWCD]
MFEGSNLKNLQARNKRHCKILGENEREFNQTPKMRRENDECGAKQKSGARRGARMLPKDER